MRLVSIDVENFRNITNRQTVQIEPDVTGLVGKNESGKTTVLKALHRLNPANSVSSTFDLTTEYPRWKLAADRRANGNLAQTTPVSGVFELTETNRSEIASELGISLPESAVCRARRDYENELTVWLSADWQDCLEIALGQSTLSESDQENLRQYSEHSELVTAAQVIAKGYRDKKESGKATAVKNFLTGLDQMSFLFDESVVNEEVESLLARMIPRFFYFSSYSNLPGECNLSKLYQKLRGQKPITAGEHTVVELLKRAGVSPADLLDDDYESRSAELQAVGWDLTEEVFKYWRQNTDLKVVLNLDNIEVRNDDDDIVGTERILKIELSDGRHGDVRTNFSTRSTGFQWFFSFFAAFSQYQKAGDSVVVLLDEPGTSLHGEAQKDFLNFIYDELGSSTQTVYTTHSQFMVDPSKYENLRAIHDSATTQNRHGGVIVSDISLSADKDTILPVESSLGYSISQHLFIGSGHHLAVEGSSDFVYLQRMSEYLVSLGRSGLDPKFSIIPVGGIDNMPAFVALLGRRLKVSALVDGAASSRAAERVRKAAENNGVDASAILVCSDVDSALPKTADIEDLFVEEDYLKLFGWAFPLQNTDALAESGEPVLRRLELVVGGKFDHALPAHMLTDRRAEFFTDVSQTTLDRFETLFLALNATLT